MSRDRKIKKNSVGYLYQSDDQPAQFDDQRTPLFNYT